MYIYIYLTGIQSLRFIPLCTIEKKTQFSIHSNNKFTVPASFPPFKRKNLRLNRPYIFHSFPPIIPFYRGLNGKPIVSV